MRLLSDCRHHLTSLPHTAQCIKWLNQIAATYALAPRYCHVLFSLEELSKRELKSSMELDEIMANRRGTRPSSPEFGKSMGFSERRCNV